MRVGQTTPKLGYPMPHSLSYSMSAGTCSVGHCISYSSRQWGGGAYPLLILEKNDGCITVQHPSGEHYLIANRIRVRPVEYNRFAEMEAQFDDHKEES